MTPGAIMITRKTVKHMAASIPGESAKKACETLGSGWRLPSDQEWHSLIITFGGYHDWVSWKDIGEDLQKAYRALIEEGRSGFGALLDGHRRFGGLYEDEAGPDLGYDGYYWSGSEYSSQLAWTYFFSGLRLNRVYPDKSVGLSCRCLTEYIAGQSEIYEEVYSLDIASPMKQARATKWVGSGKNTSSQQRVVDLQKP